MPSGPLHLILAGDSAWRCLSHPCAFRRYLLKRPQSQVFPSTISKRKIKGTIEEVKLPPKGSAKEIVHLLLKNGPDTMDVYLCPKSFMDEMGMDFTKGDEITLTGSKVKEGETDLILARELVKGNNTFVLRDAKGGPVWN